MPVGATLTHLLKLRLNLFASDCATCQALSTKALTLAGCGSFRISIPPSAAGSAASLRSPSAAAPSSPIDAVARA
eukprot:5126987-Prymnesium_polylepis.2